jgi:hypothetical protein
VTIGKDYDAFEIFWTSLPQKIGTFNSSSQNAIRKTPSASYERTDVDGGDNRAGQADEGLGFRRIVVQERQAPIRQIY